MLQDRDRTGATGWSRTQEIVCHALLDEEFQIQCNHWTIDVDVREPILSCQARGTMQEWIVTIVPIQNIVNSAEIPTGVLPAAVQRLPRQLGANTFPTGSLMLQARGAMKRGDRFASLTRRDGVGHDGHWGIPCRYAITSGRRCPSALHEKGSTVFGRA
jgi:hypothetical protein